MSQYSIIHHLLIRDDRYFLNYLASAIPKFDITFDLVEQYKSYLYTQAEVKQIMTEKEFLAWLEQSTTTFVLNNYQPKPRTRRSNRSLRPQQ